MGQTRLFLSQCVEATTSQANGLECFHIPRTLLQCNRSAKNSLHTGVV